jgi:hypothetical protein
MNHKPTLNNEILEKFMNGFFGYGNWNADIWFVGMEEGGGNSIDEIRNRMNSWDKRGRRNLEDVYEYHKDIKTGMKFFREKPALQNTWNKLIRIFLSIKEAPSDTEDVRNYQSSEWGRLSGETCLIELFPLPSPSASKWFYRDYSTLSFLINRTIYKHHLYRDRSEAIRFKIKEHQPSKVIFYGLGYKDFWEGIVGKPFNQNGNQDVLTAAEAATSFYVIPHPAAKGKTNEDFENIGRYIKDS